MDVSDERRANDAANHRRAVRAYQKRQHAAGRCISCWRKLVGDAWRCPLHSAACEAARRERRKRAAAFRRGRV